MDESFAAELENILWFNECGKPLTAPLHSAETGIRLADVVLALSLGGYDA